MFLQRSATKVWNETYVFCISVPKDLRPFHHFFFHRKAPGHFDESSTRFWPLRLPTVMHHFAPNEKNVGKPLSKANLYLWFNKEKFMKAIQNDFETLKYRNISEFWCQYLSKIFFEYISTEMIMHRMVFLVQVCLW